MRPPNSALTKAPLYRILALGVGLILATLGSSGVLSAETDVNKSGQNCVKADPKNKIDACTEFLNLQSHMYARERAAALTYRAIGWRAEKDFDRATNDLTEAINLDENYAPAFAARGDILREQGRCDNAIPDLDHAIALDTKSSGTYFSRASCLIAVGKSDQALSDLAQTIKLDANNVRGLGLLALGIKGRIEFAKGDYGAAITTYNSAIQLDSTRPIIYLDRAASSAAKGDYQSALSDYDKAVNLAKGGSQLIFTTALAARARLLASQSNTDRAIQDLTLAIEVDPNSAPLHSARAALWVKKGNNKEALADYDEVVRLNPNDANAYNDRARVYLNRGEYLKADNDYSKVIELQPNDLNAWGNRGLGEFYKGDFAAATTDFKKAFEHQPNTYSALWLYIAHSRTSRTEAQQELSASLNSVSGTDWPYPIAQLFLGKLPLSDAEAAATSADRKCEFEFYVGEWQLLHDVRDKALQALRAASVTCPEDFVEHAGALSELKRVSQ
jgi:tetratricopeptide (TPR) repeat protein